MPSPIFFIAGIPISSSSLMLTPRALGQRKKRKAKGREEEGRENRDTLARLQRNYIPDEDRTQLLSLSHPEGKKREKSANM